MNNIKLSLNGFEDEWVNESDKNRYKENYDKNIDKWLEYYKKGYEKKSKRS